jgi:hypothetical protein
LSRGPSPTGRWRSGSGWRARRMRWLKWKKNVYKNVITVILASECLHTQAWNLLHIWGTILEVSLSG